MSVRLAWARLGTGMVTVAFVVSAGLSTARAAGVVNPCNEGNLETALMGGGLVTFDCGVAPVTITLTTGKVINDNTTIDGGGLVTISGNDTVRPFSVNLPSTLTVQNLTIAHGKYTGLLSGGGIYIEAGGTVIVTNSTFSDNSADLVNGRGGGIANFGMLTVTNSTFSGNRAGFGGAIFNGSGTVIVTNSTFSGNSATSDGGGIYNGYCLDGRMLTVANSTFSGNRAINQGGGGIYNGTCGTATVTNSTFSGNSANSTIRGGAIYNLGTVTARNTIIANNTPGNCYGGVTNGGFNLQWPSPSIANDDCNVLLADPLLDPAGLANNGGPTQTIALLTGSPAIDSADPSVCAAPPVNGVDQRSFARDSRCDIGAFEVQRPPGAAAPAVSPAGLLGLFMLLTAAGWLSVHRHASR